MSDFSPPPGPPQFPSSPPLAPPPPPVPPGALPPGGGWGSPTPAPTPPPGRTVPRWAIVVGVVAVVALLGGVAVVATGDDGDDERAAAPFERDPGADQEETTTTEADEETTTTAPDEEVSEADFDAVVAEIEDFVAQERGLPFLREVTVELADDEEFEARLLDGFDEDAAEIALSGQVLQAYGLVEPGLDLVEAFRSLLGGGVVGFYDPTTDELVVRGTSTSPYVRTVIAHELTHALDDQHFELDRPAIDEATDESGFGFTALVEGNASHVEAAYEDQVLTADERDESFAEESQIGADIDFASIPIVLYESIGAPYILGPALIDAILDDGGQARLDAAFATPPTTSEALVDPSTFLAGQGSLPVPSPTADGEEIDRGVLGEFGLAQVVGEAAFVLGGFGGVADSVAGWGGDQYVAWLDGDRACVRTNLVGDTPQDTAEIGEALQAIADDPPFSVTATVVATPELITYTSCG